MHPVKSITKTGFLLQIATLWLLVAAAGCQSAPPVQEMSDARQAIAVARDAGAEVSATAELSEAEALLNSARENLERRRFTQARRDAMSAKQRALDALAVSEAAAPTPPL